MLRKAVESKWYVFMLKPESLTLVYDQNQLF